MLTDTSNFRNPNYHRPTDTVATIDAARFTLVAKGIAGAAYVIAEPVAPAAAQESPQRHGNTEKQEKPSGK
jgi:hypothetical protein